MDRGILNSLVLFLAAGIAWSQDITDTSSAMILGSGSNPSLVAGSQALLAGNYDEGIRLTLRGLEAGGSAHDRAAALSNLCAAYAAKQLPDTAIQYCTESLAIDSANWRAYSNRSYAYWIRGQFAEATFDLDAAAAINPRARQIAQIRGMINLARLTPNIKMEDLQ